MPRPERPLDRDGGPVARFAADLRTLRQQAGGPAYRSLARRANYSAATLAAAASGRRLPTLDVTLAFVTACGGDRMEWESRWRVAAGATGRTGIEPAPPVEGPAPYRGLAAFQPDDAQWFFGREGEVERVLGRLADRRFLAVFGPSGVGKSSLLRAGLVPAVRAGRLSDGPGWPAIVLTPGANPLAELAVHVATVAGACADELRDDLVNHPDRAHLVVRQALSAWPSCVELLLVVDQFEEIFSVVPPLERARFIDALLALQRSDSRARVIVAARADSYGRFAEHPRLLAALTDAQVLVGAMTGPQLREAVTKPAERAG